MGELMLPTNAGLTLLARTCGRLSRRQQGFQTRSLLNQTPAWCTCPFGQRPGGECLCSVSQLRILREERIHGDAVVMAVTGGLKPSSRAPEAYRALLGPGHFGVLRRRKPSTRAPIDARRSASGNKTQLTHCNCSVHCRFNKSNCPYCRFKRFAVNFHSSCPLRWAAPTSLQNNGPLSRSQHAGESHSRSR